MHPILATRGRLLVYLVTWVPVLALLSLVTWGAGMGWSQASAVLSPACAVYAFVCLSPWYVARMRPLNLSNLAGLVVTYAAASVAGGGVLLGCVQLAASTMGLNAPPWPMLFGMGVLLYWLSVGAHYAALAIAESRAAEGRAAEARTLARESELQALRMQINPHFLFNSLHSISALAVMDGARAREMCVKLADFLRNSLGLGARANVSLREEVALARNYLEVEQVRFGNRLHVDTEIDSACEECAVPSLLLQPLVENAVKHGIAGLLDGGTIRLAAKLIGNDVSITLENSFDPEMHADNSLGMGLAHVKRRLEVRYGSDASFQAGPEGEIYRVVLRLPCGAVGE